MSKWVEIKKRPVLPLYAAALVWPLCALALPLYSLWAIVLTAVLSAAAYLAAARFCPTRVVRREAPYATGAADTDAMLEQIGRDIAADGDDAVGRSQRLLATATSSAAWIRGRASSKRPCFASASPSRPRAVRARASFGEGFGPRVSRASRVSASQSSRSR